MLIEGKDLVRNVLEIKKLSRFGKIRVSGVVGVFGMQT